MGISERAADIAGTALVVVVITFLTIIFGELVPKRLGQMYPEAVARLVAQPMDLVVTDRLDAFGNDTTAYLRESAIQRAPSGAAGRGGGPQVLLRIPLRREAIRSALALSQVMPLDILIEDCDDVVAKTLRCIQQPRGVDAARCALVRSIQGHTAASEPVVLPVASASSGTDR